MSFDVLQAAVSRPSLWAFGLVWAAGLLVVLSPVALPAASTVLGAGTGAGEGKGWPAAGLSAAFVAGRAVTDAALGAAVIRLLITNLVRVQLVLGVALLLLALVMRRRVRIPLCLPDRPRGRIRRPRGAFLLGLPFGLLSCPGCTPLLFPSRPASRRRAIRSTGRRSWGPSPWGRVHPWWSWARASPAWSVPRRFAGAHRGRGGGERAPVRAGWRIPAAFRHARPAAGLTGDRPAAGSGFMNPA